MKKNLGQDAIYDARELGVPRMLVLGLQHLFAMFGATVLVPILVTKYGLPLSIQTTLLFAGLGTLLFHLCTKLKVPAFLGSSFAFLGGFEADTGLTGRKLMVDTYGGLVPHGGGALSGKDGTKVDRSGTYMARYIAKNIVAAGLAERCTVSLAYAIGKAEPVAVDIDTHGTGEYADTVLEQAVHMAFELTPDGMIRTLGLDRPIFAQYCSYGHFMHADAPWEQTDKAELLEEICRFKEAGASRR